MLYKKLEEIWEAERKYDDLRWLPDKPLEGWPIEKIRILRAELSDAISALALWLNEQTLLPSDRRRITILKRKLLDFQWAVIQEDQRRQRKQLHLERLEAILQPQERKADIVTRSYGLRAPLKGSDFYKEIPAAYGPQPKEGVR